MSPRVPESMAVMYLVRKRGLYNVRNGKGEFFFIFNLRNELTFLFVIFFYRSPDLDTKPDSNVRMGKGEEGRGDFSILI
jgi:hypothetical protein